MNMIKLIKIIKLNIYKSISSYIEYEEALAKLNSLTPKGDHFYLDIIKSFPRKHRKFVTKIINQMAKLTDNKVFIYNALALYKFNNNIVLSKWGIKWLRLKNLLSKY